MSEQKHEHEEDRLFEDMAKLYTREYGKKLLEESRELEGAPPTPDFDRRVRERVLGGKPEETPKRRSRSRLIRIGLTAAAALLLVAVLPRVLDTRLEGDTAEGPVLEAPEEEAPADELPEDEIIPLSFTVPEAFTVEDVQLDNGQTVYHLEHEAMDHVVMTLERNVSADDYRELGEIDLEAGTVYGRWQPDYGVVAFADGDILYVLTCAYDINTLIGLTEAILV